MALAVETLAQALLQIARGKTGMPATLAEDLWARAYDTYARTAQDVSGDAVLSTNPTGFRAALSFAGSRSAMEIAQQFDTAFIAYWTGAVFSVGIPPPPVPAGCPNVGGNTIFATEVSSVVVSVAPGIMRAQLLSQLPVIQGEMEVRARAIAQAMHVATTSAVLVLITGTDTTPPPTGPLPVTNTCTIR